MSSVVDSRGFRSWEFLDSDGEYSGHGGIGFGKAKLHRWSDQFGYVVLYFSGG